MNWGCGLVLRVDFASYECKRAAAVWNLASAEMELSVAAKSVSILRSAGVRLTMRRSKYTVTFVFTIVSYPISITYRETLGGHNQ